MVCMMGADFRKNAKGLEIKRLAEKSREAASASIDRIWDARPQKRTVGK
jgi:hypothetical protein